MQFNAETLWHFAQLCYPRVVLLYHAIKHAADGGDPCDPPRMGAKSTTTSSNHPSTPFIHLFYFW